MQVSVDFAWSPNGIDGRWFDWIGLASAADWVFVMGYDTQSQVYAHSTWLRQAQQHPRRLHASERRTDVPVTAQIWGECMANANSPLTLVKAGLQQYLVLGIPASKLVLGAPW